MLPCGVAKKKPGKKAKKKAPPKAPPPVQEHKIVEMPLSKLKGAPWNPRTISKEAMDGLGASLDRFGVLQPVIWNKRSKQVVGGHQRLKVLRDRGVKTTQVVVVDMDESAEKAANLTLNNPGIAGEFSTDLPDILGAVRDSISLEDFMALRLDILDRPPPPDDKDLSLSEDLSYAIQVECANEQTQRALLTRLEEEGMKCKPLIW